MQHGAFSACGRSGKPAFPYVKKKGQKRELVREEYARREKHGQVGEEIYHYP